MIYWLFTQGRNVLSALTLPLLCLGISAPLVFAVMLGVGIQRRSEGTPLQTSGVMSVIRVLCFVLPSLAVVALYVTLLSSTALSRATTHQTRLCGITAVIIVRGHADKKSPLSVFGPFGVRPPVGVYTEALADETQA